MFRTVLALLLALLVVQSGHHVTLMQGQSAPAGYVTLCSDGQVVSIPVDGDGNPTEPSHFCPDCMPQALVAILPQDGSFGPVIHISSVRYRANAATPSHLVHIRASARGPPHLS